MISINTKPKINKDILWRKDGEKNEIISLGNSNGGPIQFLNDVGSLIFEFSNGKNTVGDIINKISLCYSEVSKKKIEKDVIAFLKKLKNEKIVDFF